MKTMHPETTTSPGGPRFGGAAGAARDGDTTDAPASRGLADHPLAPRAIGPVNWLGLWSLYLKEVRRFLNVYTQTVAAPVITTLLFLAIFTLALGRAVEVVNGVPFPQFLAPGLIMMSMVQNAFANGSSSLVISKIQGNIVDVLMPPISAGEFVTAYAVAGITRGILVGTATGIVMAFFVTVEVQHLWAVLFYAVAASGMMSSIGIIAGLWADKFDHMAAITNFVITPFAFLSGTFYSIDRLPDPFHTIAFFNPFFYMIDGFRYGFIGVSDAAPALGVTVMVTINAVLLAIAWRLVARGYKLKA